MMKRYIAILLPLSASLFLSSCSALEEEATSFVQRETYYQTAVQCRTACNSCYSDLHDMCNPVGLFFAVEGVSDIFYTQYDQADAKLDVSPSYCSTSSTVWNNCYTGIMRCNEVIWCIENICPLDEAKKMPYAAEARAMRAYYYYFLTNFFNGVPFYLEPVDSKDAMEVVRSLPRTDANEIRAALYKDLKENALPWFTAENGLKKRTSEIEGNRAGYALSLMLMAKFAMWFEDWTSALEPLKELELLYGEFTEERYPLEEIVWSMKNTDESIFELQNEYDPAGVSYYCKWAYVAQPELLSGKYDGVDMKWYFGETVIHGEGLQCTPYYASYRAADGNQGKTDKQNGSALWQNGLFNPLPLAAIGDYKSDINRNQVLVDTAALRTMTKKVANGQVKKIDHRVLYKLGMFGLNHGKEDKPSNYVTFNQVKNNGRPWAGPQFWRQDQRSNADGNNYKLLRYADAILMMAECYCNLGNLSEADRYLTMTRTRACVDPLPYSTQDEMMSNIRDERARELGGELHRKWDLVRWGIWYESVVANTWNSQGLKENIRPYHRYYPIPDTECSLSNYVLTNDEYAK